MVLTEKKEHKSFEERWSWNLGYMILEDRFVHEFLMIMLKRETTRIQTMSVRIENASIILCYNRKFVESLTDKQLRYVLTHEIYHIVFHHTTKRKPTDPREKELDNIAADLAINSLIPETGGKQRPDCGVFPENYGFEQKLSKEQYLQLLRDKQNDDKDKNTGNGEEGYGDGDGGSFDSHDDWQESSIASEIIRNKIDEISKKDGAWGNTPGDVQAMIKAAQISQVHWTKYLRHYLGHLITSKNMTTFKRPNKRFGYPYSGTKRKCVDKKLVAIDTSGSISNEDLTQFLAEINKLQEIQPIDLLLFDHEIQLGPVNYARKHVTFDFKGRGGTCFQPVFDLAEKNRYSSVIILTDGYAETPTKPACVKNVIWVITKGGKKPVDWGQDVQITSKK